MSTSETLLPLEDHRNSLLSSDISTNLTYDTSGRDSVTVQMAGPEAWPTDCVVTVKVSEDGYTFINPAAGATTIATLNQTTVATIGFMFLRLQVTNVEAASGSKSIYPRVRGVTVS